MLANLTSIRQVLFSRFEVRKTAAQKEAFAAWACAFAQEQGFSAQVECSGRLVKSRNLVFGDPERARTLITAHYDTCARLPFPNFLTPRCWPVILLTQVLLPAAACMLLGGAAGAATAGLARMLNLPWQAGRVLTVLVCAALLAGVIALMLAGPANPHTANDNTSGVALVLLAMQALAGREDVVFVLFDNEEKGLLGSSAFVRTHPQLARRAFVINADCVSDGDTLLLAGSRAAMHSTQGRRLAQALARIAPAYGKRAMDDLSPRTLYPSDQMVFARGTAFAALKGSRILYLDRIHTPKDTVFDERNLLCLLEVLTSALGA